MLQGCLLFLGLDMFFMETNDFETKFLSGMCQVIQGHLIVARGRQCHFEWLAFYTEQRFLNFKISFHFEFTSSVSLLLIICRVSQDCYDDSIFMQNKGY